MKKYKKFLGMFLSLILSLSLFSSYTIFAQDNTKYLMKESSVQQISKDGNIIINNESYIVSNSQLKIGFKNLYSDKYLDYAVEVSDSQNLHETEYLALAFKNYFTYFFIGQIA